MYLKKYLRIFSLCLVPAMLFCACGSAPAETEPTEKPATESATEPTEDIMKNAYHKEDPATDDTLYILTAAASNSHYFLDELYGLLAAAGIKAKVCNLMRSSTGINLYYDYWKKGEKVFQLIVHDENGRTVMEEMDLDLALKAYNWDVYNMQEGNAPHRQGKTPQEAADERALAHAEIIAHIRKKCPLTKQYYQEIFAPDVGFNYTKYLAVFGLTPTQQADYEITTREQQKAIQKNIREYTEIVCKDFDLGLIPAGRAWDIARENPLCATMCGRLAVNNGEGDYLHDGDVGGGQYLNACVWFETITGRSCIGNTFRPVYTHGGQEYTLSEELVAILQQSAHQAVEELKAGK